MDTIQTQFSLHYRLTLLHNMCAGGGGGGGGGGGDTLNVTYTHVVVCTSGPLRTWDCLLNIRQQ